MITMTCVHMLALIRGCAFKPCFPICHHNRERKDLKDQLGETVFRDLWVFQDLEDLLDHPERTETR